MWIALAVMSAFFAGITAILAKCGIRKTDSDIATAIRTAVVLAFSVLMAFLAGSLNGVFQITLKQAAFLILSGLATGASWLCYFKALSSGDVNIIAPIDKSSTAITILLSIIILGETGGLLPKLAGAVILTVGVILMADKSRISGKAGKSSVIYALFSAVFAALTSILAKIGIDGVESNLATAVRTAVVLIAAWLFVFAKGKLKMLKTVDKKELSFIVLSGFSTGASWLCYYRAIQIGKVSVVAPIDKLSILVTVAFSYIVFKEKLSKKGVLGLLLLIFGTLIIAIFA